MTTPNDWRSLCAELLETIDMLLEGDRRPESERGAYIRSLLAQPELEAKRIDLDAIKQAIEERDEAALQYYHLAQNMVYHGNSVSHWHDKAKAYRDAIGKVWNELLAAGIACDGNKSCDDGVRELAARTAPSIQPEPKRPTDEEILSLADDCGLDHDWECTAEEILTFARTIQQRSTPSAIQPVVVSERLPGPDDCDKQGRCWVGCPAFVDDGDHGSIAYNPSWELCRCTPDETHWLPHHALPVPEDCEENKG